MNKRIGSSLVSIVLFGSATLAHAAQPLQLSNAKVAGGHLAALQRGESASIDGFPVGPTRSASIRFERVDPYARDAKIIVVTDAGEQELPRSDLVFLRGYSDDGSARIALSLNADGSLDSGVGSGPEGAFALDAAAAKTSDAFVAKPMVLPPNVTVDFTCGTDSMDPLAQESASSKPNWRRLRTARLRPRR